MTAGEREKQNVNKTHGRLFSPSNVHTLVQDYVQANRCSSKKKKKTPKQNAQLPHKHARKRGLGHTRAEERARIPFAPRALGTLTSTPNTATVCGRMNNLTSVRQRNEREEGGREGGCSQPELTPFYGKCRALEQTKQRSTATRRRGTKH